MPTIEPDDVYRAARTLLPSLDAVTGKALQELLDQADRDQKLIIQLLTCLLKTLILEGNCVKFSSRKMNLS